MHYSNSTVSDTETSVIFPLLSENGGVLFNFTVSVGLGCG